MPGLALALWALFGLAAMVWRIAVQRRRTGSTGVHGVGDPSSPVEWTAGALFVGGLALAAAAPGLELAGAVEPIEPLDTAGVHVVGLALYGAGLAVTVLSQAAMGSSWRIGVDPAERTALVTEGPFALVRNPIYAGMIPAITGLALVAPSALALIGVALTTLGIEIQVRAVEEPHLRRTHGTAYASYAERVGRFFPGFGRLGRS